MRFRVTRAHARIADVSSPAPYTIPQQMPVLQNVRCACRECGSHLVGWRGYTLSGSCGNCGSYDVKPVADRPFGLAVATR